LDKAAELAADLGANCLQIFSASPRMWRASPPKSEQIFGMRAARARHDISPLAIHVSYLINLASIDPVIRAKSIAGFRGELERAHLIGAEYLVLHPGSYKGQTLDAGVAHVVTAMSEAAKGLSLGRLTVLLENTVGTGAQIGSKFEELRRIHEESELETGYCLDTCHLYAAGWDMAKPAGLERMVGDAERILGLEHVKVIHANDSKGELGSRLDRHASIGDGRIGTEGFRGILNHPKLRDKPFILETPVDNEGDDRRNVDALKLLCRRSRTTFKKSS
jgi:deoxyribonuclease IV